MVKQASSGTETSTGSGQTLTFEQVVSWERTTDAQISPDGESIAFVLKPVSKEDEHPKGAIWIVPFSGGEPRRLTSGQGLDDAPRWSPDGRRLAFLSDRAERGKVSVYVMPVDGGEAVRAFEQQGEMTALEWSPDGTQLSVLFTDPETEEEKKRKEERDDAFVWDTNYKYRRLYVIDVESANSKVVSPDELQVLAYCWSPDSRQVAINTTATPRIDDTFHNTEVLVVSTEGGEPVQVTTARGATGDLTWSADGDALLYLGPAGRVVHQDYVYSIPVSGGEPRCLTPGYNGSPLELRNGANGDFILTCVEGLDSVVYRLSLTGERSPLVSHEMGGEISPPVSISAAGHRVAFVREDAVHAPNVYGCDVNDISHANPRQVTHFAAELEAAAIGQGEIVRWSSDPGVEVEGLLLKPYGYQDGERYPLVVQVHGGPTWHWSNQFAATWHDWGQTLASRGYAVLMPNPRGSTGRGPDYSNAIFGDVGGGEYRDMMTGVDAMIERGIADPDRLGVGGWSWGGYMTAWTVSQTDRFKAAVMGAGLPNMISDNGLGDIPSANLSYFETTPYHDPEPYFERSAIRHIRNATTPTLVLHGQADDRVNPAEGQEMYIALRTLGVETQFVTYPREGHGIAERKHQLDLIQRVVDWYDRFLKGPS